MNVRASVLIACIILPGCCGAFHRAEVATQAQTALIGMTKKELYLCAGVPARREIVEEYEFLTYLGGGDSTGIGFGGLVSSGAALGTVSTQHRYCEVTFVLDNGNVQRVNYQGRTGGLITQGEQCSFVVENCLNSRHAAEPARSIKEKTQTNPDE